MSSTLNLSPFRELRGYKLFVMRIYTFFKGLLLSLVFIVSVDVSADTFEVEGIRYYYESETSTEVSVYSNDYSGDVVIPSSVTYNSNTYSVTSIGSSAFYLCGKLTSIEIPNSVTSIGSSAFFNCLGLTSIEIPDGVTSIGSDAFAHCYKLASIEIPYGVTVIEERTFERCDALTSVELPNSVTSIGKYAFSDCSALTSIEIPNGVTSIGMWAFEGCSGLTSIEIPNSVTSIGKSTFRNCSGLTSIAVESGNEVYDSREGCNAIVETSTNTLIQGCLNTKIPASVTSVGESAFFGCSGLTSIDIPNSVAAIGEQAFAGCSGLTSIEIPSSVTSIGSGGFSGCHALISLVVGSGNPVYDSRENCNAIIETSTNSLVCGCVNAKIPNSVTSIGDYAFFGCSGLTSIEFPDGLTAIGDRAFSGCRALASIELPDALTAIGDDTFFSCSGLTSIVIPNSVTSIGYSCFGSCRELVSATLSVNLTDIGEYAFESCNALKDVYIQNPVPCPVPCSTFPDGVTIHVPGGYLYDYIQSYFGWKNWNITQGDFLLDGLCYRIDNSTSPACAIVSYGEYSGGKYSGDITVPSTITHDSQVYNVTGIDRYAFSSCSGLTSIDIPNSVTAVGDSAFYYCSRLTSIEIPSGVTLIGEYAFGGCSGLTSIVVESGNTVYDSREDCNALIETSTNTLMLGCVNTKIPSGVTTIGESAFSGCLGLTSIAFPDGLTTIGDYAFLGCSGLTSIDLPDGLTSIDSNAFYGCSSLTSIEFPNSVTSIGEMAFYRCSRLREVYCKSPIPCTVATKYAFQSVTYNGTLYVPIGSLDAYKAADVWKLFKNIEEYDFTTGIEDIDATQSENGDTPIHDLSGRRVTTQTKGSIYVRNGRKVILK